MRLSLLLTASWNELRFRGCEQMDNRCQSSRGEFPTGFSRDGVGQSLRREKVYGEPSLFRKSSGLMWCFFISA